MVFYFRARPEAGEYTIFMGVDKHENEQLIKYGLPEDIWFHVEKMSSAHVYLRLHQGQTIDHISEGLLEDCIQLVKANSIQGIRTMATVFAFYIEMPGLIFPIEKNKMIWPHPKTGVGGSWTTPLQ